LESEIAIYRNQELFEKVNLFNFGSPSFILAIARHFEPQIAMEGDTILRRGDQADELFLIKSGKVEVLADDEKTRIAVLCEGSYFGEIGLLLTGSRTVTVKAITACHFEVIKKDKFDEVMKNFPSHLEFLKKVAKQRVRIVSVKDLVVRESLLNYSFLTGRNRF